jgi:hypothetical protein
MMKKMRMKHWLVVLFVLGLAVGIIMSCGGGGGDNNEGQILTVELGWTHEVNEDLITQEPTGEIVGPGFSISGATAVSTGDNQCGFGTGCIPASCAPNLSCDTRERIEVTKASPGTYTLYVRNNAAANELVSMYISVPKSQVQAGQTYYMVISCDIPAGATPPIATVAFPNSAISNSPGAAICTVSVNEVR